MADLPLGVMEDDLYQEALKALHPFSEGAPIDVRARAAFRAVRQHPSIGEVPEPMAIAWQALLDTLEPELKLYCQACAQLTRFIRAKKTPSKPLVAAVQAGARKFGLLDIDFWWADSAGEPERIAEDFRRDMLDKGAFPPVFVHRAADVLRVTVQEQERRSRNKSVIIK